MQSIPWTTVLRLFTLLLACQPLHAAPDDALTIISLNIAHGRSDSFNQLLLGEKTIRANLRHIAVMLERERADVVALQEADGPSRWSGNFDHVAWLAGHAGYPAHFRGTHADSWLFDYGTGLLSRPPFDETLSHRFARSFPTAGKGFVLAQMAWPGCDDSEGVDVVSVHLDFSRDSVRQAQITELIRVLAERSDPVIVAGDFNSNWQIPGSPLRRLVDEAGLQAWRPLSADLGSYDDGEDRLDWILISDQLAFRDYRVLPDQLSDHQAVIAIIIREP
jgi:endonuclease/exonuclease/phosphatase family metal-dependent hydrolase